jgi:hypothetical protein
LGQAPTVSGQGTSGQHVMPDQSRTRDSRSRSRSPFHSSRALVIDLIQVELPVGILHTDIPDRVVLVEVHAIVIVGRVSILRVLIVVVAITVTRRSPTATIVVGQGHTCLGLRHRSVTSSLERVVGAIAQVPDLGRVRIQCHQMTIEM